MGKKISCHYLTCETLEFPRWSKIQYRLTASNSSKPIISGFNFLATLDGLTCS